MRMTTWKLAVVLATGLVLFGFAGAFDPAAGPTPVQALFLSLALLCLVGLVAIPGRAAYRAGRDAGVRRRR
jgi:hypothetical protein